LETENVETEEQLIERLRLETRVELERERQLQQLEQRRLTSMKVCWPLICL